MDGGAYSRLAPSSWILHGFTTYLGRQEPLLYPSTHPSIHPFIHPFHPSNSSSKPKFNWPSSQSTDIQPLCSAVSTNEHTQFLKSTCATPPNNVPTALLGTTPSVPFSTTRFSLFWSGEERQDTFCLLAYWLARRPSVYLEYCGLCTLRHRSAVR